MKPNIVMASKAGRYCVDYKADILAAKFKIRVTRVPAFRVIYVVSLVRFRRLAILCDLL